MVTVNRVREERPHTPRTILSSSRTLNILAHNPKYIRTSFQAWS